VVRSSERYSSCWFEASGHRYLALRSEVVNAGGRGGGSQADSQGRAHEAGFVWYRSTTKSVVAEIEEQPVHTGRLLLGGEIGHGLDWPGRR